MNRLLLTVIVLWLLTTPLWADEGQLIRKYNEDTGLSQGHATQIVQDRKGLIWIATWNGLNRFDGYEFQRMSTLPGDGCTMPSDRIRDIWLSDSGEELFCQVDDSLFLFDLRTYRFRDLRSQAERQRGLQLKQQSAGRGQFNGQFVAFTDRQQLEWQLHSDGVHCLHPLQYPCRVVAGAQHGQIRCMARDRQGRIWVTTREDAAVRLYDGRLNLIGYLSPAGRIQSSYVSFGASVYSFFETPDGTVWLGAKPDGLFRLRPLSDLSYSVQLIDRFEGSGIYDIKPEPGRDRLWLATLGGGIQCVEHYGQEHPLIVRHVGDYPTAVCQRVRFLHLRPPYLLATTTEGLIVGKLEADAGRCRFKRHMKEADRPTSLSCNAAMDILEDSRHRLFVSTESGGVCQVAADDLWADTLTFRKCRMNGGWPSEVALSLTTHQDKMLITCSNQLIDYQPETLAGKVFDLSFFGEPYRFSEVHPLLLDDGRWLLGTLDGAYTLHPREMMRTPYVPPLVLTGISIQNGSHDLAVDDLDTLFLSPSERSLSISFSALDYTYPERIRYAFRLGKGGEGWNVVGHNHTVTLLDLKPGTYELCIRSTNAGGEWVDNQRTLVIIARPTFWETPWAILLFALIGLAVLSAIAYTLLYIRRIKRQRQETLEKYLALMEERNSQPAKEEPAGEVEEPQPIAAPEDDAFMQRVMAFVEQNLGNADADVGQMAESCAVSRSSLQRKMKQLLGVTPLDFIREARIKQACQLFRTTDLAVSEVAYKCGFSDPKYFARCFKQSTGQSPSDFKRMAE